MSAEQISNQTQASRSVRNLVGRVLAVHGSQASVGLKSSGLSEPDDIRPTLGKLLGIQTKKTILIGVITDVSVQTMPVAREQGYHVTADLDLLGEIQGNGTATARFQRGVTTYPAIGDDATEITSRELRMVYNISVADAFMRGCPQPGQFPASRNLAEARCPGQTAG